MCCHICHFQLEYIWLSTAIYLCSNSTHWTSRSRPTHSQDPCEGVEPWEWVDHDLKVIWIKIDKMLISQLKVSCSNFSPVCDYWTPQAASLQTSRIGAKIRAGLRNIGAEFEKNIGRSRTLQAAHWGRGSPGHTNTEQQKSNKNK